MIVGPEVDLLAVAACPSGRMSRLELATSAPSLFPGGADDDPAADRVTRSTSWRRLSR